MDLRALPGCAGNLDGAADLRHPLAHRAQAQVARILRRRVKADPIIADAEPERIALAGQADFQPVGPRM